MGEFFDVAPRALHIGWVPVLSFTRVGALWRVCILGVSLCGVGRRMGIGFGR